MGTYLGQPEINEGILADSGLGIDPATIAATATSGINLAKRIFGGGGGKDWKKEPVNYEQAPNNKVSLFEHSQFKGSYKSYGPGSSVSNMKNIGFNDRVSSIKVPKGLRLRVYEHANFRGRSRAINSDTDIGNGWWNDKISSFRVEGQPIPQNNAVNQALPTNFLKVLQQGSQSQQGTQKNGSNLPVKQPSGTQMNPVLKYALYGVGGAGVLTLGYLGVKKLTN